MISNKYNRYPFIALFIIHIALVIYAIYKHKDKKTLCILLLTNIGFAYLFEYFILNLFQGYKYTPEVVKNNQMDNIFGAILSQAIYVPFTATFLSSFQMEMKWKMGFTLYFTLIEITFKKLKLFHTRWWKTIYTTMLLPLFFIISDFWFDLLQKKKSWALLISYYCTLLIMVVNFLYALAVTRIIRFGIGFRRTWTEHFKLAPLYAITFSLIAFLSSIKTGLLPKAVAFIVMVMLDVVIYRLGLVKIKFKHYFWNLSTHACILYISVQLKNFIIGAKSRKSMPTIIKHRSLMENKNDV